VANSVASKVACNSTIIALNSAMTDPDVSGVFNSAGYNFIGRIDGGAGLGVVTDRFGTIPLPLDPLLSILANNGGGTLTMALLPASPALDAGNDALAATLVSDQRGAGFPRLQGAGVDIGAFELDLGGVAAPTIVAQSAGSVTINPVTHLGSLNVSATVNPNSLVSTAWLQFGLTTSYGSSTEPVALGAGAVSSTVPLPLTGLAPGLTWHYRVAAASAAGTNYGPDQSVSISVPGDINGDGVVSQAEFDAVRTALLGNELAIQNSAGYYTEAQVRALQLGTPLLSQIAPGQFKLTIALQKATQLTDFSPFPMTAPQTTINGQGQLEFLFSAPNPAAFFRLEAR
jgi:hypothetical protein